MSKNSCIFIVGHPGAGKALLAKTLAEKLGWRFIDADLGLEYNVGCALHDMLGKEGEKQFYRSENSILQNILTKENVVVTTNGSVVCDKENRALLAKGLVVYVAVSTATQMQRMSRNSEPLLPVENIEQFLDQLHHERDTLYDAIADITVRSDDNALDEHVSTVAEFIEKIGLLQHRETASLEKKEYILMHKTQHTPVHLSPQQAQCLKLLSQGRSSKEIAKELSISPRTVEGYIAKMVEQLGCSTSKELISLYFSH